MARKHMQSVHLPFDPDHYIKDLPTNQTPKAMPIIHCTCGAPILVLPDLKAMNKAIENHIAVHSRKSRVDLTNELRDFLIKQLFAVAAVLGIPL